MFRKRSTCRVAWGIIEKMSTMCAAKCGMRMRFSRGRARRMASSATRELLGQLPLDNAYPHWRGYGQPVADQWDPDGVFGPFPYTENSLNVTGRLSQLWPGCCFKMPAVLMD